MNGKSNRWEQNQPNKCGRMGWVGFGIQATHSTWHSLMVTSTADSNSANALCDNVHTHTHTVHCCSIRFGMRKCSFVATLQCRFDYNFVCYMVRVLAQVNKKRNKRERVRVQSNTSWLAKIIGAPSHFHFLGVFLFFPSSSPAAVIVAIEHFRSFLFVMKIQLERKKVDERKRAAHNSFEWFNCGYRYVLCAAHTFIHYP